MRLSNLPRNFSNGLSLIVTERGGGGGESVKLMSRRENKELAKTNLKNMGRFLHGSDTNHQLDTWTLALQETRGMA